jgi:DNA mismatch endonuclease (patch repair protein)
MARIRRADTKPELIVRRLLHSYGYRFRTQFAKVPGRPDVAFPARKKCIQVHGCFWHAHGCAMSNLPKTRTAFWGAKFAQNKERDARLENAAANAGWETLTIWECETGDVEALRNRLVIFLGEQRWR